MKIAILGWGSLIWDKRELAVIGTWMTGGPVLPIEFTRISGDGRLTLIIDERYGVDVTTRFVQSSSPILDEAITNLHQRERCHPENIGFVELSVGRISDRAKARHPMACERIQNWAKQKGFDAVVWTALSRRFKDRIKVAFSPMEAVNYLQKLPEPQQSKALDYIRNAPPEVITPLRTALAQAGLVALPQTDHPAAEIHSS